MLNEELCRDRGREGNKKKVRCVVKCCGNVQHIVAVELTFC